MTPCRTSMQQALHLPCRAWVRVQGRNPASPGAGRPARRRFRWARKSLPHPPAPRTHSLTPAPEGEHAQRPVGLVAGAVRHALAPEVVGEEVPAGRAPGPHVGVMHDGPHVVVHELAPQRAPVAQAAGPGQQRRSPGPGQRAPPPPAAAAARPHRAAAPGRLASSAARAPRARARARPAARSRLRATAHARAHPHPHPDRTPTPPRAAPPPAAAALDARGAG